MSKYTTTVYNLIQNNFDFGLNDYPIFNEEYRVILNEAILEHYKFKEIAYQNPHLWRDRLRARMAMIMRNKYNQLYKQKELEFNPLYNIDITETFTRTLEGTEKNENKNTNESNDVTELNGTNTIKSEGEDTSKEETNGHTVQSQFPSEEMMENDLSNNLFVDLANKSTANSTTNTTNKSNNEETNVTNSRTKSDSVLLNNGKSDRLENESYSKTTKGSSAGLPFSRAMLQFKEFVEAFALDQEVIDELQDLFITIW